MSKPPSHLTAVGGTTHPHGSQAPSRAPQVVLDRLRQAAVPRLELACGEALSKADDAMFDLAQHATTNTSQQAYFDAMREIRRERRQIESVFRSHITAGFTDFLQHGGNAPMAVPGQHGGPLSLLAQDELEEQLAAEQSASTMHRRFKLVIEPITRGLARMAIAIAPNFDPTCSPVAPERLAMAFRSALGGFAASAEVKLVLFKLYERELILALETLYPDIMRILVETGFINGHVPRLPQAPAAPLPRSLPPDFNLAEQVPHRQRPAPEQQQMSYDGTGRGGYQVGFQSGESEDGMLNSLHEMLQVWRKMQNKGGASTTAPAEPEPTGPELSSNEMLSVLQLFQADLPDGLKTALQSSDHSLAQQLKRELITGAAALGISQGNAKLGDAEEDAIDVVGMMFEVFLDERDIKHDVRDQIARLLVPYIKVALIDRRLFLHKAHPARRLLNAIAEACEGNHGEGPYERELLEQVGQSVDRLVAEFNEDIAIFELLEQELRTFIEQYKRRADLAERRVAEAQRGKERLEEARMRAEALLKKRLGSRSVSPLVQDDLNRYWVHHYAVLFLREGEDGEGCMQALRTLDQMLSLADAAFHTGGLTALAETDSLQTGLMAMLASSGLTADVAVESARTLTQHLMQPPSKAKASVAAPAAVPPATAADAIPTPAQPAVATDSSKPLPATARPLPPAEAPPAAPLNVDPADVARLRQLAVGSWVEFVGEDDRVQPGKLSWISPISARMLFVNKRGARMHVASAEELAAMMKEGKLRLRVADAAFDQAMHQVLGRLREVTPAAGS
jgi:hypothetical protein